QMPQVLVGPRRPHRAVEARLVVAGVPAETEAVAVDAGQRFERPHALLDERMARRRDVVLERDRFSAIGDPAAHGRARISGLARDYPDSAASGIAVCAVLAPINSGSDPA